MEFYSDNTTSTSPMREIQPVPESAVAKESNLIIDNDIKHTGLELFSNLKTIALVYLIFNTIVIAFCTLGVVAGICTQSFRHQNDMGFVACALLSIILHSMLAYIAYRLWKGSKILNPNRSLGYLGAVWQ